MLTLKIMPLTSARSILVQYREGETSGVPPTRGDVLHPRCGGTAQSVSNGLHSKDE